MRTKETISDNFKAIERHFIKQDITQTEAIIQALALVTEALIDIRTNLARMNPQLGKEAKNDNEIPRINEVS